MLRLVAAVALLALLVSGCQRQIDGQAVSMPMPGVAVTGDGYGVQVGSTDADVQLLIFIEPQCPHCHRLQRDFSAKFIDRMADGSLAITYRPLTFLDDALGGDTSARAADAMFQAVSPEATAMQYQEFMAAMAEHTGPGGPTYLALAIMAGLPVSASEWISGPDSAVDTTAMDEANAQMLGDYGDGTPTVVDLGADDTLDTSEDDWFDRLFDRPRY